MGSNYIVYLPWHVRFDNNERYTIPLPLIVSGSRDNIFVIKVPHDEIDTVARGLLSKGFRRALPAMNKGEAYSLSMRIHGPWELHVRIFSDGRIESEVEISREYLQHLTGSRFNVVYETLEALRGFVSDRKVCIKPLGRCIDEVFENIRVELKAPNTLIPWKPIMAITTSLILTLIMSNTSGLLIKF